MPYAVVDLETTGVFPKRDRIVELAVVSLTDDCQVAAEYSTLVNPHRDVGPTSIHGIETPHVLEAPTFAEIAGDVAARLDGRILVGHNSRFEEDFLREEFRRADVKVGALVRLCTLRMAYALDPDESSRKLEDCCARAGVPPGRWHFALEDARATAQLFSAYRARAHRDGCAQICQELEAASLFPLAQWPKPPQPSGRFLVRHEAVARSKARRHYLGRLVGGLRGDEAPTADQACYLEVLDRALLDRVIEPSEAEELLCLAGELGLGASQVHACHHLYMRTLVGRALEDGILTAVERSDIGLVARMLGVSDDVVGLMLQQMARPISEQLSLIGKVVCFTGDFGLPREEATQRAESKGVVVMDSVTKKTHVLVAADPDSASGKAEQARRYGIPIISQRDFWARLGLEA